ncbi:MAG: DUF5958 family protein [Flavobacteriales bacterium]
MNLEEQILINKYGQGLIDRTELLFNFNALELERKRAYLSEMVYLILQSKPENEDIGLVILDSGLKPTYTPCVLLKKGIALHNLNNIISLPEIELERVFVLFLSLFKLPYQRRFVLEKDNPGKWWYWDLSDQGKVDKISKGFI